MSEVTNRAKNLIIVLVGALCPILEVSSQETPDSFEERRSLINRLLNGPANSEATTEEGEEGNQATDDVEYRLIPDDVVEITVHGEEELLATTRLNKKGEAMLVLLGAVKLDGLTLEEAAMVVRDAYMVDYLIDPTVSVVVKEYGKATFAVLGEVKTPGYYFFAGNQQVDLVQAIAMAGSYTRLGSPKRVFVKRRVEGEEKVFKLNAKAMMSGNETPFIILSGDIITVAQSIF